MFHSVSSTIEPDECVLAGFSDSFPTKLVDVVLLQQKPSFGEFTTTNKNEQLTTLKPRSSVLINLLDSSLTDNSEVIGCLE